MTIRWLLATLHVLALGLGLGAVWFRGRALREVTGPSNLPAVFHADNGWGLAALLWIGTGLLRAFGGFEKGTAYYLDNRLFLLKMALLAAVLLLEIRPMVTLVRWRIRRARGGSVDLSSAPGLARTSVVQAALVVAMVFAATAMARGMDL